MNRWPEDSCPSIAGLPTRLVLQLSEKLDCCHVSSRARAGVAAMLTISLIASVLLYLIVNMIARSGRPRVERSSSAVS